MNQIDRDMLLSQTHAHFTGGFNCAEATLEAMIVWMNRSETPRIATALGGGLSGTQGVCGVLTGGLMAIGLSLGRDVPSQPRDPAYMLGKEYIAWWKQAHGDTQCRALCGVDFSDPAAMAAFRTPGAHHDTYCGGLVRAGCVWLMDHL